MRSRSGFSLIETVLALALVSLCLLLCLPFLNRQREVWARLESGRDEFDALTYALSVISRDLQEAGYRCEGPPLRSLGDDSIEYCLSREGEQPGSDPAAQMRLVSVYRQGRDLMYRLRRRDPSRSEWERGSVHTLASGLEEVCFLGVDGGGEVTDVPAGAAAVEITLRGGRVGPLRTFVTLRNGPRLSWR